MTGHAVSRYRSCSRAATKGWSAQQRRLLVARDGVELSFSIEQLDLSDQAVEYPEGIGRHKYLIRPFDVSDAAGRHTRVDIPRHWIGTAKYLAVVHGTPREALPEERAGIGVGDPLRTK